MYLFPIIAGKGEGAKGGEFSSLMRMPNYLIKNYAKLLWRLMQCTEGKNCVIYLAKKINFIHNDSINERIFREGIILRR